VAISTASFQSPSSKFLQRFANKRSCSARLDVSLASPFYVV
jgi:hypothetical protein